MPKIVPTEQALALNKALNNVGIETKLEYYDGHKHVDICIPAAKIYIEVDGSQHYTNPKQIISDFTRDQYSVLDGFHTLHLPNQIVDGHVIKIARAIKKIVNLSVAAQ
jgi:very-short-patch-repair endonuclease